ncbi:MAG: hypothetical protein HY961_19625 [Ignavibacteriae bacterium]|nr:hypothetical protein [Ignavibacteriota bacterium]
MKYIWCLVLAGVLILNAPAISVGEQKAKTQLKKKTTKKVTQKPAAKPRKSTIAPKPTRTTQSNVTQPPAKSAPNLPTKRDSIATSDSEDDEVVGKTASGEPVYEGARGGHYYIGVSGEKVFVKEFVGAKIVDKTHDGQNIFEGSNGGRFYYNAGGMKVYVRK